MNLFFFFNKFIDERISDHYHVESYRYLVVNTLELISRVNTDTSQKQTHYTHIIYVCVSPLLLTITRLVYHLVYHHGKKVELDFHQFHITL